MTSGIIEEILYRTIKKKSKETKWIQIGKYEVKESWYADDMSVYISDPNILLATPRADIHL